MVLNRGCCRGCSIYAVELITRRAVELLRDQQKSASVNSVLVDMYLWYYRRQHRDIMDAYPYHRVRSIYY